MEIYNGVQLIKIGKLILLIILSWIIVFGIYLKLNINNKDKKYTKLKTDYMIFWYKKEFWIVLIAIVLIIIVLIFNFFSLVDYFTNSVVLDDFYVSSMAHKSRYTYEIYAYGDTTCVLTILLSRQRDEIFEEFFIGHTCEIEYWKFTKKIRRIKILE